MMLLTSLASLCVLAAVAFAVPAQEKRIHHQPDLSDHAHDDAHGFQYDHEAFLGKEEAKTFDQLTPEESKDRLAKIVDRIDTDKDGYISHTELHYWIKHRQRRYIEENVNKHWRDYDKNQDDKISWEEYKNTTYGYYLVMMLLTSLASLCVLAAVAFAVPAQEKRIHHQPDLSDHAHDDAHGFQYDHEAFLGKEEAKTFDQLTPMGARNCNHAPRDPEANREGPWGRGLSTAHQDLRRREATHPDGNCAHTPEEEGERPQMDPPRSNGKSPESQRQRAADPRRRPASPA